ncbi:hypothetical protein ACFY78_18755 [Streptomyces olindensis]|uniref:hypothetical protein n=1 Tax=Streptomyces olindensis TaxID=358823 RepID=UPI0036D1F500
MTPYERLMAEEIPTGRFGYPPPPQPRQTRPAPSWTPEEQAQHLADLLAALDGWEDPSERAEQKRQHRLQLVHDQADQTPTDQSHTDAA